MLAVVTTVLHVLCIVCVLAALLKVKKSRLRHLPVRRTRVSRHHGESTLWLERLVNALVDMFFYGAQEPTRAGTERDGGDIGVNDTTHDAGSRMRVGSCVLTFFDLWKLGRDRAGMNDEAREADWLKRQPRNPLLATLEECVSAYLEDSGLATWAEFQVRSLGERPPRVRIVHVTGGSGTASLASQPTPRDGHDTSSSTTDNQEVEATRADRNALAGVNVHVAALSRALHTETLHAGQGPSSLQSSAPETSVAACAETFTQHSRTQPSSLPSAATNQRDDAFERKGGSENDDNPATTVDSRRRRGLPAWWTRLQPRLPWKVKTATTVSSASGQSVDAQNGVTDTAAPIAATAETVRLATSTAAAVSSHGAMSATRPLSRPPAMPTSEECNAFATTASTMTTTVAGRSSTITTRPAAPLTKATRLEVEAELEYSGSLDIALRAELALMRGRRLPLYVRVGEVKYMRVHVRATIDLPSSETNASEAAAMGTRATAAAAGLSPSASVGAALECHIWLMSDPAFDLQLHTTFSRLAITDFFLIPIIAKYALLRLVHARLRRTNNDGLHLRIPLPPGLLPRKTTMATADATMMSTPLDLAMRTP